MFLNIACTYPIKFWKIKKIISFFGPISDWDYSPSPSQVDKPKNPPSSEISYSKGSPSPGSAISKVTRSMEPILTDNQTFIIPGNQFSNSYNHDISFQPSASMLSWHLETWQMQHNTELKSETFTPLTRRWFLQMLEKDFPTRYSNALERKLDGSIARHADGKPKIRFSAIDNDKELRNHLRSIK